MEKLFDNIDKSLQYKILFKSSKPPVFGHIIDIDSTFIYIEFNDKTPVAFHKDSIESIIPAKGERPALERGGL